jgi:dienelactone hydrolase
MLVKLALSVFFVLYLVGCSSTTSRLSISTTTGTGASEQIPATLLKPAGSGPFPAIVIMHECSGLGARSSGAPERWARELLTQGYVVLMPR